MNELDLLPTEVGEDLRATLRTVLARQCHPADVTACFDGDRSLVTQLWSALARDLGLAGLLIGEEYGGAGVSTREVGVVLEELGAAVAPVPFLSSAVVATTVLNVGAAASNDKAADLLRRLASAESIATLLVPFSVGPTAEAVGHPPVHATGSGLEGAVTSVADALEADILLVPIRTEAGVEVHAVDPGLCASDSVRVVPVSSLDMTRQLADVTLRCAKSSVVVPAAEGALAVLEALRVGAGMLASEQAGLARRCLETTVTYLKERRQFGRAVGGFQALKHRLADLYVDVEGAKAAAAYAAAVLAANPNDVGAAESAIATAVAQAWCSDVAVRVAEEAIQLHGGIGMTWEHPAHLFLKRAKADQIGFGSTEAYLCELAELVDLPTGTTRPG